MVTDTLVVNKIQRFAIAWMQTRSSLASQYFEKLMGNDLISRFVAKYARYKVSKTYAVMDYRELGELLGFENFADEALAEAVDKLLCKMQNSSASDCPDKIAIDQAMCVMCLYFYAKED